MSSDTIDPSSLHNLTKIATQLESLVVESLTNTPSNRPRRSMTRATQYKELGSSPSVSEAESQLGSKEASEGDTAAGNKDDRVDSDVLTEAEEEAEATPVKKPTTTYKKRGDRTKAEIGAARRQVEDRRKDFEPGSWEYMALTGPCIPHHDLIKWNAPWIKPISTSELSTEYLVGARHRSFFGPEAVPVVVRCTPEEWEKMGGKCPSGLTLEKVADQTIGKRGRVRVYDGQRRVMPLGDFIDKYNNDKEAFKAGQVEGRIKLNVLDMEISSTDLGRSLVMPKCVRDFDLSDRYSPRSKEEKAIFPEWHGQLQAVMTTGDCFTSWHVDAGGQSAMQYMIEGQKIWYWVPPTEKNLKIYHAAENKSCGKLSDINLFPEVYAYRLLPGHMLITPAGSIHAVKTIEPSFMITKAFLTAFAMKEQMSVTEAEATSALTRAVKWNYIACIFWRHLQDVNRVIVDEISIDPLERPDLSHGMTRGHTVCLLLSGARDLCDWIMDYRLSSLYQWLPDWKTIEDIINRLRPIAVRWITSSGTLRSGSKQLAAVNPRWLFNIKDIKLNKPRKSTESHGRGATWTREMPPPSLPTRKRQTSLQKQPADQPVKRPRSELAQFKKEDFAKVVDASLAITHRLQAIERLKPISRQDLKELKIQKETLCSEKASIERQIGGVHEELVEVEKFRQELDRHERVLEDMRLDEEVKAESRNSHTDLEVERKAELAISEPVKRYREATEALTS